VLRRDGERSGNSRSLLYACSLQCRAPEHAQPVQRQNRSLSHAQADVRGAALQHQQQRTISWADHRASGRPRVRRAQMTGAGLTQDKTPQEAGARLPTAAQSKLHHTGTLPPSRLADSHVGFVRRDKPAVQTCAMVENLVAWEASPGSNVYCQRLRSSARTEQIGQENPLRRCVRLPFELHPTHSVYMYLSSTASASAKGLVAAPGMVPPWPRELSHSFKQAQGFPFV
jgi:hypothetical protein